MCGIELCKRCVAVSDCKETIDCRYVKWTKVTKKIEPGLTSGAGHVVTVPRWVSSKMNGKRSLFCCSVRFGVSATYISYTIVRVVFSTYSNKKKQLLT